MLFKHPGNICYDLFCNYCLLDLFNHVLLHCFFSELVMSEMEIRNFALVDIEKMLLQLGIGLHDFASMAIFIRRIFSISSESIDNGGVVL